ncbi:helix-turn-helix domain-containing protein [Rhodoligotrophos ferricapiens]|uniref:helix-turn-helix domain-containing protein n=1 Tax=Rhodoligotrophos ferricapiens TaxID=3069264 RepID=UPI003D8171AC
MEPRAIAKVIGANIQRRRAEIGLSLDEVAKAAGTSKSHIWALEKGRSSNPTVCMLLQICAALRTNLNDLLGFDVSEPQFTAQELELVSAHRRIFGRANETRE